jgi:hypothetical protein
MTRCLFAGRPRQTLAPLSPAEQCGTRATFINLFVRSQKQIGIAKVQQSCKQALPRRLQIVALKRKRVHHVRIFLESF